jgi:hypothetical protein
MYTIQNFNFFLAVMFLNKKLRFIISFYFLNKKLRFCHLLKLYLLVASSSPFMDLLHRIFVEFGCVKKIKLNKKKEVLVLPT